MIEFYLIIDRKQNDTYIFVQKCNTNNTYREYRVDFLHEIEPLHSKCFDALGLAGANLEKFKPKSRESDDLLVYSV